MESALDHIEAAIAEVTKAREALLRTKSPQVRAADERDKLKAVAFAWFKTHRGSVQHFDLASVDTSYQTILDAADRLAARTTYARALKEAKAGLVLVRRGATAATPASTQSDGTGPADGRPEAAPSFSSLASDPAMQEILDRRWQEVQLCKTAKANLAATVMMGGLLETLLLARINATSKKSSIFTARSAPRDRLGKSLSLSDWKLVNMVEVAHELGWISKSAKDVGNVLRDFRNYVHPHKEHTDGVVITDDDASIFWEVCKTISKQILGSVGRSP
jgi:hypothetical protein